MRRRRRIDKNQIEGFILRGLEFKEMVEATGLPANTLKRGIESDFGMGLKKLKSQLMRRERQRLGREVEAYFKANPTIVPEGARERWAREGNPKRLVDYEMAFYALMAGKTNPDIARECGVSKTSVNRLRAVVLPDVEAERSRQAQATLPLVQGCVGLNAQQKTAFELIAVEGMNEEEAAKELGVSFQAVSNYRRALSQIPPLKRFLIHQRFSKKELAERRERRLDREHELSRVGLLAVENGFGRLKGTLIERCRSKAKPLESGLAIISSLTQAAEAMHEVGFKRAYVNTAEHAILHYESFRKDPKKTVLDLQVIYKTLDDEFSKQHLPEGLRGLVFSLTATPKYVGGNELVRKRIREISDTWDAIDNALNVAAAPMECRMEIKRHISVLKKPRNTLLTAALAKAGQYNKLRQEIISQGHPTIVAEYVGTRALFTPRPFESLRKILSYQLAYEHKQITHKYPGIADAFTGRDFVSLLRNGRAGDTEKLLSLMQLFGGLCTPYGSANTRKRRARILGHLLLTFPEENIGAPPAEYFADYASFVMKLDEIRRARIRRTDNWTCDEASRLADALDSMKPPAQAWELPETPEPLPSSKRGALRLGVDAQLEYLVAYVRDGQSAAQAREIEDTLRSGFERVRLLEPDLLTDLMDMAFNLVVEEPDAVKIHPPGLTERRIPKEHVEAALRIHNLFVHVREVDENNIGVHLDTQRERLMGGGGVKHS